MNRYILSYSGSGTRPAELSDIVDGIEGVNILDHEIPRKCLIEATEEGLEILKSRITGWSVNPEMKYSTGPHKHSILKPPSGDGPKF